MVAQIKAIRFQFTKKSTISECYLNNTLFGYFIEDTDRGLDDTMSLEEIQEKKKYGITAIPSGTYNIEFYNSPKHGKVPLLKNVKDWDMVEIHPGNFASDSLGCLLLGSSFGNDVVKNSKNTVKKFIEELEKYDSMFITISRR